jgi:hypothetical protein
MDFCQVVLDLKILPEGGKKTKSKHKFKSDFPGKVDFLITYSSVDCQQLKCTGAMSAGRGAACNDFIPTACVRNMTAWGGPGTLNWTWD